MGPSPSIIQTGSYIRKYCCICIACHIKTSNIKKTCIFNCNRAQVCEYTHGGRIIYQRGGVSGLLSTAQRGVLKALKPEVADISLVIGDNSDSQSGRAVISSCFSRSGRSSISSNRVAERAANSVFPGLFWSSVFSITHCFSLSKSSPQCDAFLQLPI